MNNDYFKKMASQLQSRLSKRSNKIVENEMWKKGYAALGRAKEYKQAKKDLKELHTEQYLDKKLLALLHCIEEY